MAVKWLTCFCGCCYAMSEWKAWNPKAGWFLGANIFNRARQRSTEKGKWEASGDSNGLAPHLVSFVSAAERQNNVPPEFAGGYPAFINSLCFSFFLWKKIERNKIDFSVALVTIMLPPTCNTHRHTNTSKLVLFSACWWFLWGWTISESASKQQL